MKPSSTDPAPLGRLQSVQVLRGLAALLIVVFHAELILSLPQYGGHSAPPIISGWGWMAVNLFFVISGFIIAAAHHGDIGRPERLNNYLRRRFIRIYPIYWVFLTAYILAAFVGIGHPDFAADPLNLLGAYLLFGTLEALSLPLKVAWTLFYEIRFYLAFALLLVWRRVGIAVLAGWMLASFLVPLFAPGTDNSLVSPFNLGFAFGIAAWAILPKVPRGWGPAITLLALVIVALCASSAGRTISAAQRDLLLMLGVFCGCALLLVGLVRAELDTGRKVSNWLLAMGDASYTTYLVHSAIISLCAILAMRLSIVAPLPMLLTAIVAAHVFGYLLHRYLERPILDRLSGRQQEIRPLPVQARQP